MKKDNRQYLQYDEIRLKAIEDGCTDNHLLVGLWAKAHGYIKVIKQIRKKRYSMYFKNNENV